MTWSRAVGARAQHIQFGMTPSARSKIISTLQDEDPLETALQ